MDELRQRWHSQLWVPAICWIAATASTAATSVWMLERRVRRRREVRGRLGVRLRLLVLVQASRQLLSVLGGTLPKSAGINERQRIVLYVGVAIEALAVERLRHEW